MTTDSVFSALHSGDFNALETLLLKPAKLPQSTNTRLDWVVSDLIASDHERTFIHLLMLDLLYANLDQRQVTVTYYSIHNANICAKIGVRSDYLRDLASLPFREFARALNGVFAYLAATNSFDIIHKLRDILIAGADFEKLLHFYNLLESVKVAASHPRPTFQIRGVVRLANIDEFQQPIRAALYSAFRVQAGDIMRSAELSAKSDRNNAIVFFFGQISPLQNNTATTALFEIARVLLEADAELRIVCVSLRDRFLFSFNRPVGDALFRRPDIRSLVSEYGDQYSSLLDESRFRLVDVFDTDYENYSRRVATVFADIKPDVVVSWDTGLEILGNIISQSYPAAYIQLVNGMVPRFHCDLGLYVDVGLNIGESRKTGNCDKWLPITAIYKPQTAKVKYENIKTRVNPEDFAIVTAAVDMNQRLHQSEQHKFFKFIDHVLSRWNFVCWTVVGIKVAQQKDCIEAHPELGIYIEAGRLRFIEFEDDLPALYGVCDLMIHPPVRGGGRGVALAAMHGVPVIVFKGSDPAHFVPQKFLVDNWSSVESLLEEFLSSKHYLAEISKEFKGLFSPANNLKIINQWLKDILSARDIRWPRN